MRKPTPTHTKRFAGLVFQPGGLTAEEAVAAAEARLETIRDSTVREIGLLVDQITSLAEDLFSKPSLVACDALYAASNSVVGVAGVFGLAGMGEVAFSLCTLLDRQRSTGSWNTQAIQLHIGSLRLMSGAQGDGPKRAVIDALRQVVDRVTRSPEAIS